MTLWQFLASLPLWVWGALIVLLFFIAFLSLGGAAAAAIVAIFRGGKVKISKTGLEADAPEAEKNDPPTPGVQP